MLRQCEGCSVYAERHSQHTLFTLARQTIYIEEAGEEEKRKRVL